MFEDLFGIKKQNTLRPSFKGPQTWASSASDLGAVSWGSGVSSQQIG